MTQEIVRRRSREIRLGECLFDDGFRVRSYQLPMEDMQVALENIKNMLGVLPSTLRVTFIANSKMK